MGQKVNPVGFRVAVNHDWDSVWYNDKDYTKNLLQDLKIQDYITKKYVSYAISKVIIERTGNITTVFIKTSKPGVIIGKKGSDIEKIKKEVEKLGEKEVSIKILEVDKPDLDARLVGQSIARQLENRAPFKRVVKKAIQNAMKFGALGIKVSVAGRLGGVEMARTETYKEGSIPLHTLKANIDYAHVEANTIYGIIGVKVWIYKRNK